LINHKKFFDKAKNQKYLKDNLIKELKPLTERFNALLNIQASEYFEKIDKKRKAKENKIK